MQAISGNGMVPLARGFAFVAGYCVAFSFFLDVTSASAVDDSEAKLSAESRLFGGIFLFFVGGAIAGAVLVNHFKAPAICGAALLLIGFIVLLSRGRDE